MDNLGQRENRTSKEVTGVISRNIKPGHEKDYDDWLRRYMILENKVPGYLGTTIIAPGGNTSSVRYIINRFSDKASMDAWESSGEALKLIEEADNCSTRHYASATGLEAWFSVPDFKLKSFHRGGKWPSSYSLQHILLARCHILSLIHSWLYGRYWLTPSFIPAFWSFRSPI